MKRNLFAAALISMMLAGTAGSALASDAYPDGSQFAGLVHTSVLSRAQVKAEIGQARAQGLIDQGDAVYPKAVVAPDSAFAQNPSMQLASADVNEISPQP